MAKHSICHIEWQATDLNRAKAFYGGLFNNWKFEPWGESYLLFQVPDGIGGGIMKTQKVSPGQSPTVYIQVDEIEPYLQRAKKLGGKVTVPKTQIDPSVGWSAHLADPDGNTVGLFQSSQR
jgi:hypothetical protein